MLDTKAVELINKLLEKGFDIEIQMRKDTIVILSEKKQVAFSYPVKKR